MAVIMSKQMVIPSTLPPIGTPLNDCTWEQISEISNLGLSGDYFSVGDIKEVTLNGTVGTGLTFSNYKAYIQILAFDHNKDVEMNGESHIVFGFGKSALSGGKDVCFVDSKYESGVTTQYLNMNTSESTSGGWQNSKMRTVICPAFKLALPSELQAVLRSRTIYTDNKGGGSNNASNVTATSDNVYISSEFELSGTRSQANTTEQNYQNQLTYYANGNSKVRYKHDATTTSARLWLRSPCYNVSTAFCNTRASGAVSYRNANFSEGFVPLITV